MESRVPLDTCLPILPSPRQWRQGKLADPARSGGLMVSQTEKKPQLGGSCLMMETERLWLQGVIAELQSGELHWDDAWLREQSAPPEEVMRELDRL